MALTEQSSVVFSIQQLLDTETNRQATEKADREAELNRKRELRRQELEREHQRMERQTALEREAQQRQSQLLEAESVRSQLRASNAMELDRLRHALEHEYEVKSALCTRQVHTLTGRQRILVSALATGLLGTVFFWFAVVLPGQHRANVSYAALSTLYESSLKERRGIEESFQLERQQMKQQINALLVQSRSRPSVPEPAIKPVGQKPKPVKPESKPPCTCLTGDPLCTC